MSVHTLAANGLPIHGRIAFTLEFGANASNGESISRDGTDPVVIYQPTPHADVFPTVTPGATRRSVPVVARRPR